MAEVLLLQLGVSLFLTLFFELIVALVFRLSAKDLILVILVNCLTNPPVVLLYASTDNCERLVHFLIVLVLETAAILVEGVCYRAASNCICHPFRFSFIANAVSYLLGILIS